MAKKILIFSLAYYPNNVSGAEVAIKEITDRIDPKDIEFHMVTLKFDSTALNDERVGNVEVHRVSAGSAYLSKILFIPLAVFKAISLSRKYKFDAYWGMLTYMLLPISILRILGWRIPHAVTLQDGDPYEKVFGRWFILPIVPLLDYGFRTAKIIQTISNFLAEWPRKRGYKGEIEMIPNGASIPSAQEYPKDELDKLKKEVGKKDGEIFLISVSRLVYQKGLENIIRALPLLPSHIRYLCVGEGEDKSMLEKLAKELGVYDRVIFTGQVDRTMTAKYRKISEIFVLPSRSEGQGISFLSTMVSGLPMVATQEGGISDFLFDAKRNPDKPATGFAVDKDNPGQIAEAVKEILAQPDEAKKVAENAKKLAHEKYSWDSIAKDMKDLVFGVALR